MEIGLVLELLKLSLGIFNRERQDHYLKEYTKLEKEYMNEMSKPDNERSDLALDRLRFDARVLAKLVVAEANHKS